MLHASQLEVDEAWIVFRLGRAPPRTEQVGDLNGIALLAVLGGLLALIASTLFRGD